jgi:transposase InsO family protein
MEERKHIASGFIQEGIPKYKVLSILGVPRSSHYYKPISGSGRRGIPQSEYTLTVQGVQVPNATVLEDIKDLLGEEFVDYGYLKTTHWLRQEREYTINPKKVYRLMRENGLLNKFVPRKKCKRNWVSQLLPPSKEPFDYLEFDIKYFYVAGKNRNALLLSVIDVETRWVVGHLMGWEIKQGDVLALFEQIFQVYPMPKGFHVRNDNGSQFIAQNVQDYFKSRGAVQEFCKPATPEQNAHIESYHSIQESVICQRYELESLKELQATLNRFVSFYNFKRIHSGVAYKTPYKYLKALNIDMDKYDLKRVLDCTSKEGIDKCNLS